MANGVIALPSNHNRMEGRIYWESSSNGSVQNNSTVTGYLQVRKTDTYTTYGTWTGRLHLNATYEDFSVYAEVTSDWVTLKTMTITVPHNNDGTGSCYLYGHIAGPAGTTLSGYICEGDGTAPLDTIPRYANFTEHYIYSVGLNSIRVKWNADAAVDCVQYSINDGAWIDTAGLLYTIGGLAPNTWYNIRTRIRRTDSGLWTETGHIGSSTYDIARVSTYSDLNLGDNLTITYTNPSGASVMAGIYGVDGATSYASYRNVSNGSYTFDFTDEELDKIYKAMQGDNSIALRLYLATAANEYNEFKPITIYLTGNQKTGWVRVDGVWKRCKKWVNVNGTWKRCVRWIKVDGSWKRCI